MKHVDEVKQLISGYREYYARCTFEDMMYGIECARSTPCSECYSWVTCVAHIYYDTLK